MPPIPTATSWSWDGEFAHLRYQSAEERVRHRLSVKQTAYWTYCGPCLLTPEDGPDRSDNGGEGESSSLLPASFWDWALQALGGDILPQLLPLLSCVREVLASRGVHHYWLTLRATRATAEFDKPRWHTDKLFFGDDGVMGRSDGDTDKNNGGSNNGSSTTNGTSSKTGSRNSKSSGSSSTTTNSSSSSSTGTDWKMCTTLLGSSTLFIPAEHQAVARQHERASHERHRTDHHCHLVRCVGCATAADSVRDDLALALKRMGSTTAEDGEVSVFRTGPDRGAVHSEPRMSGGDRLFCNVVPGTEAELRKLVGYWGMEFPRSWWLSPEEVKEK